MTGEKFYKYILPIMNRHKFYYDGTWNRLPLSYRRLYKDVASRLEIKKNAKKEIKD